MCLWMIPYLIYETKGSLMWSIFVVFSAVGAAVLFGYPAITGRPPTLRVRK